MSLYGRRIALCRDEQQHLRAALNPLDARRVIQVGGCGDLTFLGEPLPGAFHHYPSYGDQFRAYNDACATSTWGGGGGRDLLTQAEYDGDVAEREALVNTALQVDRQSPLEVDQDGEQVYFGTTPPFSATYIQARWLAGFESGFRWSFGEYGSVFDLLGACQPKLGVALLLWRRMELYVPVIPSSTSLRSTSTRCEWGVPDCGDGGFADVPNLEFFFPFNQPSETILGTATCVLYFDQYTDQTNLPDLAGLDPNTWTRGYYELSRPQSFAAAGYADSNGQREDNTYGGIETLQQFERLAGPLLTPAASEWRTPLLTIDVGVSGFAPCLFAPDPPPGSCGRCIRNYRRLSYYDGEPVPRINHARGRRIRVAAAPIFGAP